MGYRIRRLVEQILERVKLQKEIPSGDPAEARLWQARIAQCEAEIITTCEEINSQWERSR